MTSPTNPNNINDLGGSAVPELPGWIPPLDTGQPSAEDLNDLSDIPRTNYAARNTVIPVPYGRDRFFPRPFVITLCETTGCLLVAYGVGEGPIAGYETFYIDGEDALATGKAIQGLKNPGFESGDGSHWTLGTGAAVTTTDPASGTYALELPVVGGHSTLSDSVVAPPVGQRIRVSCLADRDGVLPTQDLTISVRWTINGSEGGFETGVNSADGDSAVAGERLVWRVLDVPADAESYRVEIKPVATGTGKWNVDDVKVEVIKATVTEVTQDDDIIPTITLVPYTGAAGQVADGRLQAALTGFTDTYDGLAYILGAFPPGTTSGFPRLEAIYYGRTVFDPRKYNLLYDNDADPQFLTAAETSAADALWFFDDTYTQALGVSGWTSETADPSPASATYAQLIDNDDTSEIMLSKLMDVDPTKNYTVVCYVKQPSGDRRNYLMVHFEDAKGNRINNSSTPVSDATGWLALGTYHYYGIVNTVFPSSWTRYTFTFGPNAGATGTIPTGAAKMAIGGLFGRDGAVGTNTTVRVADMRVFEGNLADEQYSTDSTTWSYSTNPAICFRDMITSFSGWEVWDEGVATLANYNDEIITGTIKRREIGLTITTPDTIEKWARVFRTYMGGFIGWEKGKIRVIPNRADVDAAGVLTTDATASSWCDMGDQAVLDFGAADDFTVEFTFKPDLSNAGNTQVIVNKKNTAQGADAGYSIHLNFLDELVFQIHDGTTGRSHTDTVTNYFDGNYHKVAMVVDRTGDNLYAYHNGSLLNTVDISAVTGSLANAVDFRVGGTSGGTNLFSGVVDEVRVWNDVRTPTEISNNLNNEIENPVSDTSLVGYWRMNEVASSSTARDSSANANDGTLTGNAAFLTSTETEIIPAGVVMHITADDIVKGSLRLRRRSLRSVPNSVAVDYRDASGARWRTEREQTDSPRLSAGGEQRRISRISLPGIHNATQAKREATERLNWYLTDLEATVTLFDEGWELQHGSIVALTHPIGLTAKLFRVTRTTGLKGRWTVDMVEYDPAVYSDEVVADPTVPDTNLGNPLSPPLPTGVTANEELFNYKNGNTGSRIRITYNAANYPFLSQYLLEGYVAGQKVWQTTTQSTEVVTPPVEELITSTAVDYVVRVYTQSPFATSDYAEQEVTVFGKLAPPSDVPVLNVVQTAADTVELNWTAATDIDIWRYEIRRGSTSDTWETATDITQQLLIDGLSTVRTGIPVGTYRFFVKAIDSVGNESPNARTADVTLAVPQPPTNLTGFEVASEVRLAWQAPTTGFTERYRIAYDTIPESGETTLDIVDTLRFSTKDVPEGTWRFKVYAQDKNGVEAATAPSLDIEVTSDADSFLADTYDFIQATTVTDPARVVTNGDITNNIHQFFLRTDPRLLYVTNMGDVFSSSPSDFNTYAAEALANYHSSGNSTWLSETVDFGLLLTGSWNLTHDVTALAGVVTVALELSTDNSTFIPYGSAAKGEFRYARVRITTTTTATAFIKSPVMSLKINVVPLEESGSGFSATNQPKVVNLSREYTAVKEVNAQPINEIDGLMAVVDNIVVGGNTGIQNNTTRWLDGGDIAAFEFAAAQNFSVEFWMKHSNTSVGFMRIMGKRNGSAAGWSVQWADTSENVSMTIDDGTNEVTGSLVDACPNDGNWHHICFTVDRGADVLRGYVDGVEDTGSGSPFSIAAVTGALSSSTVPFRIFAAEAGTVIWQNGLLDDVRIWDDVRSGAEIVANKDTELDMTQTQSNLLAYWKLNGPVSGDVPATADFIKDATANGYHLTAPGTGMTFVDPGESNPILKINSFDVYVFDIFGQQLLEEFQWNWKGV